ncbi:hypothetical protein [Geitlerinema sp. PCC 9228]|uniref:hypothetical protein n=1 Tax=Geitlerinema sp. PCC 9228 TaxID=111611 RepID=UPI0008F9CC1D|nr:hypothetical protein [Geitlerinema sp. PCC 9228]
MNDQPQQLQTQLDNLASELTALSDRLLKAAHILQEQGTPLEVDLIQQLDRYRQDFTNLRSRVLELAAGSPISPVESQINSLTDLKHLLEQVDPHQADNREAAVQMLDRVLQITHRDNPNQAQLLACKDKAQQLKNQILAAETEIPQETEELAKGEHPFAHMLELLEKGDSLDDDRWAQLQDTVATAFGQPLAVALSRGKLKLAATEDEQRPQPAPASSNSQSGVVTLSGQEQPQREVVIFGGEETPAPVAEPAAAPHPQTATATAAPPATASVADKVGLKVLVHIQGMGDREFRDGEYAGTRGQARALEGYQLDFQTPVAGLQLKYMAHIAGMGDTKAFNTGEYAGTRGKARRLEGFAIQLDGPQAANYDVFYRAHVERMGDTKVHSNGQYCGTKGKGLRVEGMQVWIEPKAAS